MGRYLVTLVDGEQRKIDVYHGKWAQQWTTTLEPGEGEPAKEVAYQDCHKLMCPSHRSLGYEIWEGPGVVAVESRNYM